MCLLIVANKEWPRQEILEAAQTQNSDGIGIAWKEGKKVHWKKGLKLEELDQYKDVGYPTLIHFRAASAGMGGNNPQLCHPFPITRTASLDLEGTTTAVLAHNGNWHKWETVSKNLPWTPPEGPWSDTRAMAWIGGLANHTKDSFAFFEKTEQKLVYFSSKLVHIFGKGWTHDKETDTHYSYDIEESIARRKAWNERPVTSYTGGAAYDFFDSEEEELWKSWWIGKSDTIPPTTKIVTTPGTDDENSEEHLQNVENYVNNIGNQDYEKLSTTQKMKVLEKLENEESENDS